MVFKIDWALNLRSWSSRRRRVALTRQRSRLVVPLITLPSHWFFCTDDGEPVLVIVSGASRVDERKVSAQLGKSIHRADAQFVRDKTGFSIGGVLPLGHRTPPVVMINVDGALGEWVDRQLTPQPVMTVTQPIQLTGRHIRIQQKVYIRPKGITRPSLIASSKSDLQTRRGILS